MTRLRWGRLAPLAAALLFLLVSVRYAYDSGALGARTSGLVQAAAWALTVLAALAGALGVLGALRSKSTSLALRLVNSLWGRIAVIALSLAAGLVFLVAAWRVGPSPTWTCTIINRTTRPPQAARCGEGSFAQMRSFQLQLVRASDATEPPVAHARAADRAAASVAIDSDRGGLCVATGPDRPTWGESQLSLTADCGADRTYPINLHVCDVKPTSGALRAVVALEIREGGHAETLACE